mmetsp:Transcript_3871/g.13731  ORF Transcript_3871/g.13731 Transcript_3871/m.13731 type:complete len:554 (-) Transcript_3871:1060-2721(-)
MFYAHEILARKGPLGTIWLAAHLDRKQWMQYGCKLNKKYVTETNIDSSVETILYSKVPLALRLTGHLLLGVVRIFSAKVTYLESDAREAMDKIKQAYRPAPAEHAAEGTQARVEAITLPDTAGDLQSIDLSVPAESPTLSRLEPGTPTSFAKARRESITLEDAAPLDDPFAVGLANERFGDDLYADTEVFRKDTDGDDDQELFRETTLADDDMLRFDGGNDMMQDMPLLEPDGDEQVTPLPLDGGVGDGALPDTHMPPSVPHSDGGATPMDLSTPNFDLTVAGPSAGRKRQRRRGAAMQFDTATELTNDEIRGQLAKPPPQRELKVARRFRPDVVEGHMTSREQENFFTQGALEGLGTELQQVYKSSVASRSKPKHKSREAPARVEYEPVDAMDTPIDLDMPPMDTPIEPTTPNADLEEQERGYPHDEGLAQNLEEHALNQDDQDFFFGEQGEETEPTYTGWSQRSKDTLAVISEKLAEAGKKSKIRGMKRAKLSEGTIELSALVEGANRKKAAATFFEILVLSTRDYISVKQPDPYESIEIGPGHKSHDDVL